MKTSRPFGSIKVAVLTDPELLGNALLHAGMAEQYACSHVPRLSTIRIILSRDGDEYGQRSRIRPAVFGSFDPHAPVVNRSIKLAAVSRGLRPCIRSKWIQSMHKSQAVSEPTRSRCNFQQKTAQPGLIRNVGNIVAGPFRMIGRIDPLVGRMRIQSRATSANGSGSARAHSRLVQNRDRSLDGRRGNHRGKTIPGR